MDLTNGPAPSVQQLRCFLAAYQLGSFTAAAQRLGMAQPSVSEQVRLLERSCGTALFVRVGRGVVPSEAARALAPYAERAVGAAREGLRAARAVRDVVEGTVRLAVFGTARAYLGADLVEQMLRAHPSVRVELVGQNSADAVEQVRSGRAETGLVALPIAEADLVVQPVARDEVLYVSADPERVHAPVTAPVLARARLVLSEATWGDADSTRSQLAARVQAAGLTLRPVAEVEDPETALELAARGVADAITARGLLRRVAPTLPAPVHTVSLRPRLYDDFAVIRREGAPLSPASSAILRLAVDLLRRQVTPAVELAAVLP